MGYFLYSRLRHAQRPEVKKSRTSGTSGLDSALDKKNFQVNDFNIETKVDFNKPCDSGDDCFNMKNAPLLQKNEQPLRRIPQTMREKLSKSISLLRHQRKRCKESKNARELNPIDEEESNKDEDIKMWRVSVECDVCHKILKRKKYLRVHMRLHGSPSVCDRCGIIVASEWCLKQHIRRHNFDYAVFCNICKKGFYCKATLKTHMTTHSEEKTFDCDICKRAFANRIYLKSHMRIHDDPKTRKKYKCSICEFETFYSYCLKEHRETHTGEGRIECRICGKFVCRGYLKTHVRTHTGEKPEVCEFCGKGFASRKYLTKHRRIHTSESPYRCDVCSRRFTQRSSLAKHRKLHDR